MTAAKSGGRLYRRFGKRLVDIVVVVAVSPLAVVLVGLGWVLARASSGGSGFFVQPRVGRGMKPFMILKLRTMRDVSGASLTRADDPRITTAGGWLRRFKLDELPQLWNVLLGDMSLIGPRPEIPEWVQAERSSFEEVLVVRPGLSDLASIVYHDEASRLSRADAGVDVYGTEILPDKLRLGRLYAENVSLSLDWRLLVLTAVSILRPDWAAARAEQLARRYGAEA
ncbi:MAG TPA: sugar transferase [Acidimicrobiales bacterium]|nr:sugar transferase [Acidimicrobiales bacterium]